MFSLALWGVPKLITNIPVVLLYQSLEIPVTLKACRHGCLRSDTLLYLTHQGLHSTSSQTFLEAPSDQNTFCWCEADNNCSSIQSRSSDHYTNLFTLAGAACHWIEQWRHVHVASISWYWCESIVKMILDIARYLLFEQPVQLVVNATQEQLMQFIGLPKPIVSAGRALPELVVVWVDF